MSKAVLLSIRPKWCELIASGKKTIEVRKTAPKLKTPFKCYIYETKGKVERPRGDEDGYIYQEGRGAVIGEFVCDEIKSIDIPFPAYWRDVHKEMLVGSCLSLQQAHNYLGHSSGYGWHISALKIYDEPKELREFEKPCDHENDCGTCKRFSVNYACINSINRPPQSYMYV